MIKVENLNGMANQFVIYERDGDGELFAVTFQSYASTIARYDVRNNWLTVGCRWDRSKTTLRYFAEFVRKFTPFQYTNKAQFEREMFHPTQGRLGTISYNPDMK